MKFLIFLLLGALATAQPLSSNDEVELYNEGEAEFLKEVAFAEEDPKTELGKKLKEHLEDILEKLKEALENGKVVKEDTLEKLKEIRQKLKDMKIDIGKHAKDLLEKLKDKARDWWKNIFDKLNPDTYYAEDEDEVAQNLRDRLNKILEEIRDAFQNRKTISANVITKLKDIFNQMKEKSIPIGDKAKELIDQLKEKASIFWRRILDYISPSQQHSNSVADDLNSKFHDMLEKIKDAFKNKKLLGGGFITKLKELREKMRNNNVPIGGKAKEMIEKLKENASSFWRRILDRISPSERSVQNFDHISFADDDDIKTELGKKLKERFDQILEKVKEAIDQGKEVKKEVGDKLKEIRQKLRDLKVDIGDKAKEYIDNLKEKAKDYWKKILEKLKE